MIELPEDRILAHFATALLEELPAVLLELEETSATPVTLPPLRYAGPIEELPTGCSQPYALTEFLDAEYNEKDRIVKNTVYRVKITFHVSQKKYTKWYMHGAEKVLLGKRQKIERKEAGGLLVVRVVVE